VEISLILNISFSTPHTHLNTQAVGDWMKEQQLDWNCWLFIDEMNLFPM